MTAIKKQKVVRINDLIDEVQCSKWTLFDKIRGRYYTSYNFNRQYITLRETPRFDEDGLWKYNRARFSKWGNVEETIRQIVERSSMGISASGIADILKIRTHNQLLKCREKGLLISVKSGRNQIYYSVDEGTRKSQMLKRKTTWEATMKQEKQKPPSNKKIIDILLAMVKHPKAKPENIIDILASWGSKTNEGEVRWVVQKYGIKKNS